MGQDNSPLLLKCLNWKGHILGCRGMKYPISQEQRLPFLTYLFQKSIFPPVPRGGLLYMQLLHNSLPRICSVDACLWRSPSLNTNAPGLQVAAPTSRHQLKPRLSFPEIMLPEAVSESLIYPVLPHVSISQVSIPSRVNKCNIYCFSMLPAPKHSVSSSIQEV